MAVFKLEGTPYTAENLASEDFNIEVENLSWDENIAEFQRKTMDGTLDSYNSVMGQQTGTFKFMTPLNPGATATTEPAWSKILQACGWKATGWDAGFEVAVGSAVHGISWYPHRDYTHVPMTFEGIDLDDGTSPSQLVTKMSGCMGNPTFLINDAGEPIQLETEFQGSLVSVTDRVYGSILSPNGVSTVQPPAVLAATFTVGGTTQDFSKFSLTSGNTLSPWKSGGVSTGVKGFFIAATEKTMTVDSLADLLANDAVYTQWVAGTTGAVSIVISSSPALTLSAPVAQYSTKTRGDRDGAVTADKTFRLHKSSGNDAMELLQGAKT
jgi:hypothetical protein